MRMHVLGFLGMAAVAGTAGAVTVKGHPDLGTAVAPAGGTPPEPTFQWIQDNVFTPICTNCHESTFAPEGLRLSEGEAYDMLVGVPSNEVPARLRVEPGDPDNSYIINKVEGTAPVGGRMPLGGAALPAATITAMRAWIAAGALAVDARDDRARITNDGTRSTLRVLRNDAGANMRIIAVTPGSRGGRVTIAPNGLQLAYRPRLGRTGRETFLYTIENADGTDTATVTVTLTAP